MPAVMSDDRRARLASARLYLVCDSRPGGRELEEVLPAAIAGGVDVVQLREKRDLNEDALLDAARRTVALCHAGGAVAIINDRPEIALAAGADGVHVGQEDMPVAQARSVVGAAEMLVGLSTHAPREIDAAEAAGADYIGVGPVHETPTKPGRPAVGVELVSYAAAHSRLPFFAIGGLHAGNVADVVAAGATRVCVLRAIAEAADPRAAAAAVRAALSR